MYVAPGKLTDDTDTLSVMVAENVTACDCELVDREIVESLTEKLLIDGDCVSVLVTVRLTLLEAVLPVESVTVSVYV
jgi:hypothetical protein